MAEPEHCQPLQANLTFAPEPALLNINGVVFGLTSTDIISHISRREISKGIPPNRRVERLAQHLLLQQSFYPLYPPEVAADIVAMKKFTKITQRPHILITPSDFNGFAFNVAGTVCVNPERLAKGYEGGSFARIFISNTDDKNFDITSRAVVEVLRI